ncbi:MAG: hypothetical protein C4321_01185 [Chloroflexota bacterium]
MQPPPFDVAYPPAPKRSNKLIWVIVLGVVGCCILLIGGGGAATFFGIRMAGGFVECTIQGSIAATALKSYAASHDGKLPPAESWQTAIRADYEKAAASLGANNSGPFRSAKSTEPLACGKGSDRTVLTFNRSLGGKKVSELKDPMKTYILFEKKDGDYNANAPYVMPPDSERPKIFGKARPMILVRGDFTPMMESKGVVRPIGTMQTSGSPGARVDF